MPSEVAVISGSIVASGEIANCWRFACVLAPMSFHCTSVGARVKADIAMIRALVGVVVSDVALEVTCACGVIPNTPRTRVRTEKRFVTAATIVPPRSLLLNT